MVEFLTWWFVTHWMWASFLSPGVAFLYALFTDQTAWAWGLAIWYITRSTLRVYGRDSRVAKIVNRIVR